MTEINTHNLRVDFGRHKGKLWTRVPVSFLLWVVNTNHTQAAIAKAEIERRGTTLPNLEITGHAIDRASQRCIKVWRATRTRGEGLNAWLRRMAESALANSHIDGHGRYVYEGMLFVFEFDGEWPVLATVMKDTKKRKK